MVPSAARAGAGRARFAPAEAAWLAERDADGRARDFLRLWTAKEAVGKALGTGLRGGGLRRLMPVPDDPDGGLGPALGGRRLRVGIPAWAGAWSWRSRWSPTRRYRSTWCRSGRLLVQAVPVGAARVGSVPVGSDGALGAARCGAHVAAARSASVERTSLPVVVRGS